MGARSEILAHPQFESDAVKFQCNVANALCTEERKSVAMLLLDKEIDTPSTNEELSIVQRALKRQKILKEDSASRYLDSRCLLVKSSICERLFSKVFHVLNDKRLSISLVHLESQIYLNINRDLWR